MLQDFSNHFAQLFFIGFIRANYEYFAAKIRILSKDAKKTPSELCSVGDELANFLFRISFIFLYIKYNL